MSDTHKKITQQNVNFSLYKKGRSGKVITFIQAYKHVWIYAGMY